MSKIYDNAAWAVKHESHLKPWRVASQGCVSILISMGSMAYPEAGAILAFVAIFRKSSNEMLLTEYIT